MNVEVINEELWEIRSDAMKACNRLMNGDTKSVADLMASIESRVAEVRRQLSTPASLMRENR